MIKGETIMSMKLGNFLTPEEKKEDDVHKRYRFDSEIARQIEEDDMKQNESKEKPAKKKKNIWAKLFKK